MSSFSVPTGELVELASRAARVAGKPTSFVSGVRFVADGGMLTLQAVSSDVSISSTLPVPQGIGTTEFVLPSGLLLGVLKTLPSFTTEFELTDDGGVLVTSGNAEFEIRPLRPDDVSPMPHVSDEPSSTVIAAGDLRATIARVEKFTASDPGTRPQMMGVLINADGDQMHMVASDAYRLAVKETKLTGDGKANLQIIVPRRALHEIADAPVDDNTQIGLRVDGERLVAEWGSTRLVARLLHGGFPKYEQALSQAYPHTVLVPKAELIDAIRRCSLMSMSSGDKVVSLRFEEGALTVRAAAATVGRARDIIPVNWDAEPLELNFVGAYLTGGLEQVTASEALLKLTSATSQMVLVDHNPEARFQYLVMPRRGI